MGLTISSFCYTNLHRYFIAFLFRDYLLACVTMNGIFAANDLPDPYFARSKSARFPRERKTNSDLNFFVWLLSLIICLTFLLVPNLISYSV